MRRSAGGVKRPRSETHALHLLQASSKMRAGAPGRAHPLIGEAKRRYLQVSTRQEHSHA
jgi:hypothetical protein